jgi:hypothetical protein
MSQLEQDRKLLEPKLKLHDGWKTGLKYFLSVRT